MNVGFLAEGVKIAPTNRRLFDAADLAIWHGDYREGRRILDQISGSDDIVQALRAIQIGDICHFEWNGREAAVHYRQAIEWAKRAGTEEFEIFAVYRLVDTALDYKLEHGSALGGDDGDYQQIFDKSLNRAKASNHKFLIAFGLHYTGLFKIVEGQYAAAKAVLEEAAKVRREIDDTWHLWNTEWLIARCEAGLGKISAARAEAERIYQLQINAGLKGAALRVLLGLSHLSTMENLARINETKQGVTSMTPDSISAYLSTVSSVVSRYEAPVVVGGIFGHPVLHS